MIDQVPVMTVQASIMTEQTLIIPNLTSVMSDQTSTTFETNNYKIILFRYDRYSKELVQAALKRSRALIDINIYNNLDKQHEFEKQTILTDKFLTGDEKLQAMEKLTEYYDHY